MRWLVACLVIGFAEGAVADFGDQTVRVTGAELFNWGLQHSDLNRPPNVGWVYAGMFQGFVGGIADSLSPGKGIPPAKTLCIPSDVTLTQLSGIVMSYLVDHDEALHSSADEVVWAALHKRWPCPDSGKT